MMKNTIKLTGLLLISFLFFHSTTIHGQTDKPELSYIKLEVKGLACPFCAYGLEKKLKEIEGVKSIEIDVEQGWVFLTSVKSHKPTKESLEKIVIRSGFTPSSIIFSEIPFVLKDED